MGLTYAIQTSENENKEFSIKTRILSLFKNVSVEIPIRMQKGLIGDRNLIYYEKLFPNYLLLTCESLNKDMVNRIKEIKGVELFLEEPLTKEEAYRFRSSGVNQEFDILTGKVFIVYGEYAGQRGKLSVILDDKAHVILEPSKNKVQVPVWYVGKEMEE